MPRYEYSDEKSEKFWEIEVKGTSYEVRFGRIGTNGSTQSKAFSSADEARQAADKQIASKLKKGYQKASSPDEGEVISNTLPRNARLEAQIHAKPLGIAGWKAYAKWLAEFDAPRAELIELELEYDKSPSSSLKRKRNALYDQHHDDWLGPVLLEGLKGGDRDEPSLKLEWRRGFIYSARISYPWDASGPKGFELLEALLVSPSARFLHELVIGAMESDTVNYERALTLIKDVGRLSSLRRLHLGDFTYQECEISWATVGDVSICLDAFPNLEYLKVHGGGIYFSKKIKHEALQELCLETGGLPDDAVKVLCKMNLPSLHTLEVWLGTDEYGGDSSIASLKPFFKNKNLPALKNLGLQNSDYQDQIALALLESPLLNKLHTINLSMGTMRDIGGGAILENKAKLKHLKGIDLSRNFISKPMVKKLKTAFSSIKLTDMEEPYPDGEEDFYYVSVGE